MDPGLRRVVLEGRETREYERLISTLPLDALLRLTHMRRSVLGTVRRVEDAPEFLAALAALGRFAADKRARERLAQAAESKDPETARVAGAALKGVR